MYFSRGIACKMNFAQPHNTTTTNASIVNDQIKNEKPKSGMRTLSLSPLHLQKSWDFVYRDVEYHNPNPCYKKI